jgi:hypothetical protein
MAWMVGVFGVGIDTIGGHRDHASTTCPGQAVYAGLDELERRVTERIEQGVELRILDGEGSKERVALIEA